MRNRWMVLASIATLVPACLGAQPTRGDRLRIRQIGGAVVTPAAMQLEDDGVDVLVERNRIRTLERSLGVRAVAGGIVAIPIGVVAGIASRSERWETIAFPPPADFTLLVGTPHGGRVGVSVRLPVGRVQ